MEELDTS
jgi:hypothetical protein